MERWPWLKSPPLFWRWAHGVNSMRVVEQALRGPKSEQPELWEADIRMHPQKKIPVMAHDPEHALTSNLTFKEFLNLAYRHNKGIKLDFKDPKAVAPCLKILNQFVSAKNIEQLENFEFSAVPFADGDLGLLSAGDKADDQKHGGNGGSKQNEEEKEMRVMYKADSERTKTSLFQKENDMEVDERNEEKQSQDILLTYTDHGSNKENIALKQEGQIKKGPKREKDESLKNSDNNTSQKKHRKKNKKKKCGASLLNEPPSTPSSSLSTTTTMANKSPSSPTSLTTHKRSHLKENRPTRSPVYTPPRTPPTASPLVFPLVFINADLVMGPGGGEVCFDPKTFIQLTRECNESANPSTGSPSSSTSPPPSCLSPSSLTLSSRMDTSYVLSIGATTGACFMRNLDGYTEQHIDDLLDLVKHFPLQKVTWALRAQYLVWAWRQRPSKCQELIDNPNHTITLWGSQALKKRDFEFLLNSIPADRLMLDIAYPKAISYHLCGSIICCNGSRGEFGTVSSLAAATLDLMQRKENQNKSSEGGNRHCKNTHPSRTAGVLRGTGSTQPTGGRECLCSIM